MTESNGKKITTGRYFYKKTRKYNFVHLCENLLLLGMEY